MVTEQEAIPQDVVQAVLGTIKAAVQPMAVAMSGGNYGARS